MDRQEYTNLFRMDGKITCLHSELFLKGSQGLVDPLIISYQGSWHTFLRKKKKRICLNKGLELYRSKKNYETYSQSFRKHIKSLYKIKVHKDVSVSEFKFLLDAFQNLWTYYGFTEYFYTDLAFKNSNKSDDTDLKKNLSDLNLLKVEGRKALNYVIFDDGPLQNLLRKISQKFLAYEEDAFHLYSNEIFDLFNGKSVSKKIIENRKKCYAAAKVDDEIIHFTFTEARKLAEIFTTYKESKLIKGTVANSGHVRGRAIIAPMLTSMDEVNKINSKMKEGDILVAQSTSPELMTLVKKAAAIVTDQGGMLSHAAIISRELNIPCIVGTNDATRILKYGDFIEVDASKGIIKKINKN